MSVIAFLPLFLYFGFLIRLHCRKQPVLLNGYVDFTLLAWSLFGIITLGPGRLLVPLYLFAAWGVYAWIFWVFFYFATTHFLASRFIGRFIVYNARREAVLPAFFTLAKEIDPKTDWSGNVLSLHGLGLQWSVISGRFGRYLLFIPTNPNQSNPQEETVLAKFREICKKL